MISTATLQSFFETKIKPDLESVEKMRKRVRTKVIVRHVFFGLAVAALVAFPIWIFLSADKDSAMLGAMYSLVCLTLLAVTIPIWVSTVKTIQDDDVRAKFKAAVVTGIVRFISDEKVDCEELAYIPGGRPLPSGEFKASLLFRPTIIGGNWMTEDLVEGRLGETHVVFCELGMNRQYQSTWMKQEGQLVKCGMAPYKGLYLTANFNKSFRGHTLVVPDKRSWFPSWWAQEIQRPVALEDPEFERYFNVYSTVALMARYILTPALMRRIVEYRKKVNEEIRLSFVGGRLHMFISRKKNTLEMKPFRSVYEFAGIEEYHRDVKFALDLVEDLNLNLRIWTTEEVKAVEVDQVLPGKQTSRRSFVWLGVALGLFGAHYFYAGFRGRGFLHLLMGALLVRGLNVADTSIYALLFLITGWPMILLLELVFTSYDSRGKPMV